MDRLLARTSLYLFLLLPLPSVLLADQTRPVLPVTDLEGVSLELSYPGRHQSRTIVQGLLLVDRDTAVVSEVDGLECYVFEIEGEVLRQNEQFDEFRYRFELPVGELIGDRVPLVVQRSLRPGEYQLNVRLTDVGSKHVFETSRDITVPIWSPEGIASEGSSRDRDDFLAEANNRLGGRAHLVKIVPPPDRLITGRYRVEARVEGEGVAKVRFVLNGQPVMSKSRAPYSVEIDLGRTPRVHLLAVEALDQTGEILARDQTPINGGPHRFAIRLLEPHPRKEYSESLRAVAEVDLPRGERLERVEFFLNETRIARLYQPPWIQPVVLPQDQRITYVRAEAVLEDGNSSEDLVFVNAPSNLDQLQINMVELFVSVSDRKGANVEALSKSDFEVLEEGVRQEISRFEVVRELPIHAGLVLDTSTSMQDELDDLVAAATQFFKNVVQPKDRAAIMVFNDSMRIRVPLTNSTRILEDGLVGLESQGDTVLYDALIEALYYFAGLDGKRALILISDGSDSASRYTFQEALEFAQRSGTAIYPITLGMSLRDRMVRGLMIRLARETGGRAYFIGGVQEIDRVYSEIEQQLRSQYLVAYQSDWEGSGDFRKIEIRVSRPELKATTVPGYYP